MIVGTPKIYRGILLYLHDQTYLGHVALILQVTDQTNLQFSFYLSVPTTGYCTVKPLMHLSSMAPVGAHAELRNVHSCNVSSHVPNMSLKCHSGRFIFFFVVLQIIKMAIIV